ncbi:MAG: GxxExxY protein [Planctomycetaceae bacterium]
MANDDRAFPHRELSEHIIGSSMTVLNRLGCGLPEKVYERALVIELRKRGHLIDQQKAFPVLYDGVCIGTLVPDLVIDEAVVVDTKVVADFDDEHFGKMLSYLSITRLDLALLVNFRYPRLRWKRVVLQSSSA